MRPQLCILFMLAALAAAHVAVAAEEPPTPGYCPHALKPLPRNVNRVVDRIVKKIEPQFRDKLLETKREDLVQFQEWSVGIRDSLCLSRQQRSAHSLGVQRRALPSRNSIDGDHGSGVGPARVGAASAATRATRRSQCEELMGANELRPSCRTIP